MRYVVFVFGDATGEETASAQAKDSAAGRGISGWGFI